MLQFTKEYDVLEEIGRGKFGVVSRCRSRKTGEIYAVKTIQKASVSADPIDKLSLTNEPKALSLLSLSSTSSASQYITCMHVMYDSTTHLHLVLDYSPYPTLYEVISLHHRLPEPVARDITFSLLQAILFCHVNSVVHRDIKPENIFLDQDTNLVKLCDFGSSGFVFQDDMSMTGVVGTPYYVAPEVLERRGYGKKVDVWSVGVVLYVMVAGFPPFYGDCCEEIFEKVLRGIVRFPSRVFGNVSMCFKDFVRKLLCKDVSRRLSVEEALRHPWMIGARQLTTTT